MNSVLMDKFLNGDITINTETKKEFDLLMQYLEKTTCITWPGEDLPTSREWLHGEDEEYTCVSIVRGKLSFFDTYWNSSSGQAKKIYDSRELGLLKGGMGEVPQEEK